MANTLKLPVGIDDFRKLRESNFYYVDKTRLIEQLSFKGVEGVTYDEAFDTFVRAIGKEISRVSFLA